MKRFFQLLLAGLFLMAIGWYSNVPNKVMSIDDDVGTSISVDIQDFEIADQTQFVCSYQYQEVGIVPTENTDVFLNHYELIWYKEQLDCINDNLNRKEFAKSCSDMLYGSYRYDQATNTTKYSGTTNWYCSNNYLMHSIERNFTDNQTEEICIMGNNLFESWEVIGLVPEPNQEISYNYYT